MGRKMSRRIHGVNPGRAPAQSRRVKIRRRFFSRKKDKNTQKLELHGVIDFGLGENRHGPSP
jgi:hypothetical protein